MSRDLFSHHDALVVKSHDFVSSVVSSSLQQRGVRFDLKPTALWTADFFGLHRIEFFRDLPSEIIKKCAFACQQSILNEAYFIEQFGMSYGSRRVLMADALDERILFSFFTEEEAVHFTWISSLMSVMPVRGPNVFLDLLEEVINASDPALLTIIIQVILEGWGLIHYKHLGDHCIDPKAAHVFSRILKDEARHHGTGVKMADVFALSASTLEHVEAVLSALCTMIQVGPMQVAQHVEHALGGFNQNQRVVLFEQLNSEQHASSRLKTLSDLIRGVGSLEPIRSRLEAKGLLSPLNSFQSAEVLRRSVASAPDLLQRSDLLSASAV